MRARFLGAPPALCPDSMELQTALLWFLLPGKAGGLGDQSLLEKPGCQVSLGEVFLLNSKSNSVKTKSVLSFKSSELKRKGSLLLTI